MMSTSQALKNGIGTALDPEITRRILDAIQSLHFGAVEVTVHEGRVVQIDRRERTRISSSRD